LAGPGAPGQQRFGPGNFVAAQWLEESDQDQDGRLSRLEFGNLAEDRLRRWDRNQDAALDALELAGGLADMLPPPPRAPEAPWNGRADRAGSDRILGPPIVRSADADRDGKISQDEWEAQFAGWFEAWDRNRDGRLEEQELRDGLNEVLGPGPGGGGDRAGRTW
jgi:hypothetical protein